MLCAVERDRPPGVAPARLITHATAPMGAGRGRRRATTTTRGPGDGARGFPSGIMRGRGGAHRPCPVHRAWPGWPPPLACPAPRRTVRATPCNMASIDIRAQTYMLPLAVHLSQTPPRSCPVCRRAATRSRAIGGPRGARVRRPRAYSRARPDPHTCGRERGWWAPTKNQVGHVATWTPRRRAERGPRSSEISEGSWQRARRARGCGRRACACWRRCCSRVPRTPGSSAARCPRRRSPRRRTWPPALRRR